MEKTAKEYSKELLGHLPLHQDLRNSADIGDPLTHSQPDHEVSKLFKNISRKNQTIFSLNSNELINSLSSLLERFELSRSTLSPLAIR